MTTDILTRIASEIQWQDKLRSSNGRQIDLNDKLIEATYCGDLNLVRWLLSQGAQVDYWQDPVFEGHTMEEMTYKSSAILVACQQGNIDIVLCLHKSFRGFKYEQNQRANMRCGDGLRHYWAILIETLKNRDIIQGRQKTTDDDGYYIDFNANAFLHPYCFLDDLPLLKYLIDIGTELDVRGQSGKTALMKAAGCVHYTAALKMLLHAGADPDIMSRQHHSALVCAVRQGNMEAMRILLDFGACITQPAKDFDSTMSVTSLVCPAMIYSVSSGKSDQVKLLMDYGAQPNSIPRYLLYILGVLHPGDLTTYTDCVSYLYLAFYSLQTHIIELFLETNFLTFKDFTSLRQDKDLLSYLQLLTAAENEYIQSLNVGQSSNRGDGSHRPQLHNPPSLNSDDNQRAATTLKIFKCFTSTPLSLISLSVLYVRHSLHREKLKLDDQIKCEQIYQSLCIPPSLVRALLGHHK